MQDIQASSVDSHVVEIESEALFPLRRSSMMTVGEAEKLRNQLNGVLEE